jgi:hypothetical protein
MRVILVRSIQDTIDDWATLGPWVENILDSAGKRLEQRGYVSCSLQIPPRLGTYVVSALRPDCFRVVRQDILNATFSIPQLLT